MIEIERKFLVKSDEYKSEAFKVQLLSQAYLNNSPEKSVRIRIVDNEGFLTIKGPSYDGGLSRFEWEKNIPISEAKELMKLCGDQQILKKRYFVKYNNIILEVDEFLNNNNLLGSAYDADSNGEEGKYYVYTYKDKHHQFLQL